MDMNEYILGTECSIQRGSETSQLGRQTWQGESRAGAPKRPLPSGAAEGLYKVACPAYHFCLRLCAKARGYNHDVRISSRKSGKHQRPQRAGHVAGPGQGKAGCM